MDINSIKSLIRKVPNYPKRDVMFYDLSQVFASPSALSTLLTKMEFAIPDARIKIASPEARGFILGSALADRIKLPFVPIRKKGKLPNATYDIIYKTEYSTETLSIHKDAIRKGDKIVLIDDILATGGTLKACANLIEKSGGKIEKIIVLAKIASCWEKAMRNLSKYGYEAIITL